ncbi:MAG: ATP-binding protein [Bdellovibrionales bacterium]
MEKLSFSVKMMYRYTIMQQSSIEQKPFIMSSHKLIEACLIAFLFFIGTIVTVLAYLSFIGVISFVTPSGMMKIDFAIILALSALLGRRIVVIFLAHKKSLMASGLHMKMVMLFSAVSLVPAAFMAFFSLFFFHYGVQSWFSEQIKTAVVESNSIAQSYLEEHQNTIRADILAMANDLDRQYEVFLGKQNALKKMVDTQAFYRNLTDAVIFSGEDMNVFVYSGLDPLDVSHVSVYDLDAAMRGEIVVLHSVEDDNVQALVKLNNYTDYYLLVGRGVDATVLSRIEQTRAASQKYTSLEGQSSQIRIALIVMYVALSAFLVLVSIWFALRIAKNFIRPIESLVDASNRVRAGDLDVELDDKTGVMELDHLTQAYNRMTSQLSKQRNELVSANRQLDERRIFTETVLGGVSSGVLSVDNKGTIKLYNTSAETILKAKDGGLSGASLKDIIPEAEHVLERVLVNDSQDNSVQIEIPYIDPEGAKKDLLLRAVSEVLNGKSIGAILTFDDITRLKSAQRTAAWSDVARRIAHEIKNPLTPIQLSADRIGKKFAQYIPEEDRDVFETCIETISCHVNDIGAMVTEFSSFARMPEPKVAKVDLSALLRQCVVLHEGVRPDIDIVLMGLFEKNVPVYAYVDEQLIRQAFVNVLQNALDAIPVPSKKGGKSKSMSVWVWLVERGDNLCIAVRDSGEGFPEGKVLDKFLDPYVTYKENGTGLGLAIVKKIVSDHGGKVVLGALPWMEKLDGWGEIDKKLKKGKKVGAVVSMMLPVIHDTSSNEDA